jgi:two-component system invasion response regulator UvrY
MGPVKLFLVEDELLMRQAFARALSVTEKYEVVGHSADGQELVSNPTDFNPDVIILDTVLSGHSWLETIQHLKSSGVQAPILVLSADNNLGALKTALQAGARGVLAKGSDLGEMEHAIDAVAQGETYVSPNIHNNSSSSTVNARTTNEILSTREHEIFLLLAAGKKNRDIGKMLSISTRTVDTHRSNILKKLQVKSNAELVRLAISEGLLAV